ncbi:MAG: hypothetical protein ACREA0_06020 [bacterium]
MALYEDWRGPVAELRRYVGAPSSDQLKLAERLAVLVHEDEPFAVLGARLEENVQRLIWGREPSRPASDRQIGYLRSLLPDVVERHQLTLKEASAWISYALSLRTIEALERLHLRTGDEVVHRRHWRDPAAGETRTIDLQRVVSTIRGDGLVFFRGGNGQCAPATSIVILSKLAS